MKIDLMKQSVMLFRCCLFCGLLWSGHLAAQSVFSVQCPGGLPFEHSTGPSASIGGSGVGVANDFFSMADNPGNLGTFQRSVFSALASLDLLSIGDNGESTEHLFLSPRLISFGFPLGSAGVFGFSLDRRSNANYRYRTSQTVEFSNDIDTVDFGIAKNGGLTVWQAGWGYALGRFARIGLCYERVYFSSYEINMWRSGIIGGEGSSYLSLFDTTLVTFRGNGLRAGVLVPYKKITVGLSGEYIIPGKAQLRTILDGPLGSRSETEQFSLRLPQTLDLGVSYSLSPGLLLAASSGLTFWQNYYSGVTLGSKPENTVSFSGGAQFVPAPNLLVPRYWEIMQYRAGFRFAQLPAPGTGEAALTLGAGLPLQQGSGLFDIILEFGRRFDSNHSEYSENYLQLMLGINGGRKWFRNTGMRY